VKGNDAVTGGSCRGDIGAAIYPSAGRGRQPTCTVRGEPHAQEYEGERKQAWYLADLPSGERHRKKGTGKGDGKDMEILRTEHLFKKYGKGNNEVIAVNDANLSVDQGEFVAIVGSSGSGKSTLMHMLGGVDRPTSGRVLIEDNDIYRMNDDKLAIFRRRQVGLIYQFYNLIPVLTVEENLTLPCELDGNKPDPELVQELAGMLGLKKRLHHLPNELSGGQQQRVAIGRALITRPAILLADEPTGNLDTRAGNEIMELLKISNRKYKQTVVMITHNLELAKQADRVLGIEDGFVFNRGREA